MKMLIAPILLVLVGCQTDQQLLAGDQTEAVQVAARRAQFEMNCPAAKGTVLSSNVLQPIAWRGLERAEYTVGVEGCGQRRAYIVVCQVGSVSSLRGVRPVTHRTTPVTKGVLP